MGQDASTLADRLEERAENIGARVEAAATRAVDAFDAVTQQPLQRSTCQLSECESKRASALFDELRVRQGLCEDDKGAPRVLVDAMMLDFLGRKWGRPLVGEAAATATAGGASWASSSGRACTLEEWNELLRTLQMPRLLLEQARSPLTPRRGSSYAPRTPPSLCGGGLRLRAFASASAPPPPHRMSSPRSAGSSRLRSPCACPARLGLSGWGHAGGSEVEERARDDAWGAPLEDVPVASHRQPRVRANVAARPAAQRLSRPLARRR